MRFQKAVCLQICKMETCWDSHHERLFGDGYWDGWQPIPLMVPILSILCPKHPLLAVDPPFFDPALSLREPGWSFMIRAKGPLARVSTRRSLSRRTLFSILLWLSSDASSSDSSSPNSIRRDCGTHGCRNTQYSHKQHSELRCTINTHVLTSSCLHLHRATLNCYLKQIFPPDLTDLKFIQSHQTRFLAWINYIFLWCKIPHPIWVPWAGALYTKIKFSI